MSLHRHEALVVTSLFLVAFAALIASAEAKPSKPAQSSSPPVIGRMAIQVDANGLFASVQADGTVLASSPIVGPAEQFDVHDLGKGLFALASVANGKFLTARVSRPLVADADSLGDAQAFRRVGAEGSGVRFRAVAARAFVCAANGGAARLTAEKQCPQPWQVLRVEAVEVSPAPSFAVTAPVPGTVLRGTGVRFTWDRAGDEAWLAVGTMPGASDIYASGPLGTATEHTALGLPLNGATVYVQVRRQVGATIEQVNAHYTAAVRKGLAVITDFEDRRLEDWTGPGMRHVDDLAAQLRQMEAHWAWLSRGVETFRWDIIRIQLPQPAVADAYAWWSAFREAAVALARQQVDAADYDVNADDVIDAVWLIVSMGHEPLPFVVGGMSRNGGANLFVDGQASGSVVAGATGNFNHELGHCLGLPDMYGRYSTMNKLTIMNDSWAQPPQDFSAYERVKLGWVKPQVLQATTRGVWLPSAHDNLAAVMVPTSRSDEYFLVEYRRRPASGYGSAAPHYAGLAVYHVLEGSSMWQDPPIVKLEPADGRIAPEQALDPYDFVYPENPALLRPLVFRSYYDDADEVFRIENVAWRDGGLAFDVIVASPPAYATPQNLLSNPSFETGGPNGPDGWEHGSYANADALFGWSGADANHGTTSVVLESAGGNDLWWRQVVGPLASGEHYRLCGFLKGEGVRGVEGDVGANVSVLYTWIRSEEMSGTFDWTTRCVDFQAPAPYIQVACRLGFYWSTAKGKLWCDSFSLEHVRLRSAF
jgi:hypothetical protein